jgi:precorrin-2 dehydrogenase
MNNKFYMACIDLSGKTCLVVGGGPVGLEKIEGLLASDADVRVVALETVPEVRALADGGRIELHERAYDTSDLDGIFLVVAATSNTELNERVHAEADARNLLVNVVDVPALCNFILPAVVRNGPVAVAISTAGASPALAKRMKREIADGFGPAYARLAELLNEVRPWAKKNLSTYEDRKQFFESIVNGDPDPIALLSAGDEAGANQLIAARVSQWASGGRVLS